MKWFQDQGVQVLDWPGNSPDLNPIENLWNMMKRRVARCNPSSLHDLKQQIMHAWCNEVTSEECLRLIESMPRRISAVMRNHGYPAKY
jgi:transposase